MIAIKVDFPAGRWHATAWGSHVNEGVPEWPPCPWRLCRALLAAWHWKHRRDDAIFRNVIEKLAAGPAPEFRLPNASAAHTRHYMPVIAGPKETRTKIFDTFIHINADESLWIRWDVDLNAEERSLLGTLLEHLSYMGRAESLVSATLADELPVNGRWTATTEKNRLPKADSEPIRLLAPQSPDAYAEWLTRQVNPAADKKTKAKTKGATLPPSVFHALQLDTADWKKDGWNLPPGARWIEYSRPRDCLSIAPRGSPPSKRSQQPTVARFAIVSKVPPAITQALSLGERFHQALCSRLTDRQKSPTLTGCDDSGAPLTGNKHVYFLPECDAHGYITHMTLHAPGGFDDAACRAFGQLRKVWGTEGFDVKIVLLATGYAEDFEIASPYFRKAKTWRSLTPFVPVRHPKATRKGVKKIDPEKRVQIGSPEHDCWRLIEAVRNASNQNLPVARVSPIGTRIKHGLRDIPCLDFQCQRRTGNGTRADHRGYALEIEFSEKTSLPLGFGYAAHFGLGLFVPA
jgi:CRISPR-associated protein Csb2